MHQMCSTSRRGLTLVELLASLALLSFIMIAAAEWMGVSVSLAGPHAQEIRHESALQQTFLRIEEDVLQGDWTGELRIDQRRVRISGQSLTIATRSTSREAGAATVTYTLNASAGTLIRRDSNGNSDNRVLTGGVASWTPTLTTDEDTQSQTLVIEVIRENGESTRWSMVLP